MKPFKKIREALSRLVAKNVAQDRASDKLQPYTLKDSRVEYREKQRDFERRARDMDRRWASGAEGTLNIGRNAAKRAGRAALIARGASPRVARRKQRDGIVQEAA